MLLHCLLELTQRNRVSFPEAGPVQYFPVVGQRIHTPATLSPAVGAFFADFICCGSQIQGFSLFSLPDHLPHVFHKGRTVALPLKKEGTKTMMRTDAAHITD